jgi:hypothetical protein
VILDFDQLAAYRGTVAMVDGAFDPLHRGHIEYFRAARERGLPPEQAVICREHGTEIVYLATELGVSYRGYRKDGADVVIMVESVVAGRPEIRGAIVPRPKQGGRLLVEPFPKSLTAGRSLTDGAGACAVDF